MTKSWLWLVACSLFLAGCDKSSSTGEKAKPAGEKQAGDTVQREGEPAVTFVDDDDPKMNAAMKKAGDTIGDFLKSLEKPTPKQTMFAVKIGVGEGDNREYMWLTPVTFKEGQFSGKLNNEPVNPQKYKLGDTIVAPQGEVVDWMYAEDGVLVGGYTLRVLRDSLSPKEREEFDAGLPMKIQ